ncbi:ferrous iron transport protein A [Vibrio sp. Of7-15]|uniref:FeoA family protein n=1 Tax=Vibrio sp. Of7-15 TaxID=2724879 RepID=UPI001EF32161|nr:FeoA family protein [Vibrio sp. Of7-15]MCG7495795.1 ferrous iron transport protein A [Vibrio sp. Of7-15]
MKLAQLQSGVDATITDMSALPADTRKKLMVMGVLPNTQLQLIRRAPLGDPLQVMVRGVAIALRKQLAEQIDVKVAV